MRRHLTYANVVSTLCLILVLGGGTAMASLIITKNSQVDRGTISGHHPPSGDHPNIIGGSLSGADLSGQLRGSLRLLLPSRPSRRWRHLLRELGARWRSPRGRRQDLRG